MNRETPKELEASKNTAETKESKHFKFFEEVIFGDKHGEGKEGWETSKCWHRVGQPTPAWKNLSSEAVTAHLDTGFIKKPSYIRDIIIDVLKSRGIDWNPYLFLINFTQYEKKDGEMNYRIKICWDIVGDASKIEKLYQESVAKYTKGVKYLQSHNLELVATSLRKIIHECKGFTAPLHNVFNRYMNLFSDMPALSLYIIFIYFAKIKSHFWEMERYDDVVAKINETFEALGLNVVTNYGVASVLDTLYIRRCQQLLLQKCTDEERGILTSIAQLEVDAFQFRDPTGYYDFVKYQLGKLLQEKYPKLYERFEKTDGSKIKLSETTQHLLASKTVSSHASTSAQGDCIDEKADGPSEKGPFTALI